MNQLGRLRAATNSILTSHSSLSSKLKALNVDFAAQPMQPMQPGRSLRSAVSSAAMSPVAGSRSLGPSFSLHSSASLYQTQSCMPLMATDTVAPCMRGANKNKALVKEVRLPL